jgi:Relaxase/Mobilisation nuclease domain
MIIKGGSRAGPSQLARHLQRTDTNERVHLLQLDSPTASLGEALRDWQLLASGTRGSKGLYHVNIDPDARYAMTEAQWRRSVDVLEKELGLEGQPRAVVLHEKNGRAHIHVVWQRTDIDSMTLVSDSFNYKAHERASLALEQEFGHEIVPGKHAKRNREKQPEIPKAAFDHAEWQQGERSGIDPRAFKEAVTALYEQSDNGKAFQVALEEQGLVLAKGDRRDFVVVDSQGQIHSLSRQVKGVTAKDLRAFMSDLDRDLLPSTEQAKAMQRERAQARQETPPQTENPAPEELAKLEAALKARHDEEAARMRERQATEYKNTSDILDAENARKRDDFEALKKAERDRFEREHPTERRGLEGFIAAVKAWLNPEKAAEETRQREQLSRRQDKERENQTATLAREKERDLSDLAERHAQQRREHAFRLDQDLARYARERDTAQRLLAEIEEQRRKQELESEQRRQRDGPPPPSRAR